MAQQLVLYYTDRQKKLRDPASDHRGCIPRNLHRTKMSKIEINKQKRDFNSPLKIT